MEALRCAYDSSESGSDSEQLSTEPERKRGRGEPRYDKDASSFTLSAGSKCQWPTKETQRNREAMRFGVGDHLDGFAPDMCHSVSQGRGGERKQPTEQGRAPHTASIQSAEAAKNEGSSKIRRYIPKRLREKTAIIDSSTAIQQLPLRVGDQGIAEKSTHVDQSQAELAPMSNCSARANRPPKKLLVKFDSGHTKGVNCVRWCPQKARLLLSASMDHSIHLWDIHGCQSVKKLECHGAAVKDARWSHCGTRVLSCGYDKMARITDIQTGQEVEKFAHKDYATCVQYHPSNSNLFLVGTFKSNIFCWDSRLAKVVSTYSAFFGQVQDMAFLPGEEAFVSAAEVVRRNSTDKGVMVWDFRSTAILSNQIYQEAFTCTCLQVHPSEAHFIAQSSGDYIAIFSTKRPYKLNKLKRYEGHKVAGYHIGCDFSPDGSVVASGSSDGKLFFYNQHSSRIIKTIPGHSMASMDVAYHPSLPSTVASCGWDGTVAVWE